MWDLPVPAGPIRQQFSAARIHSRRGEVVEGRRRDRGGGEVELVEGLDDRERGRPHPGAGVGLVAGGDLGLDQGAEELLGVPPLGLRGDQQLGGEAAHRGHLQPLQPVVQVGGQRRRAGGVTAGSPLAIA